LAVLGSPAVGEALAEELDEATRELLLVGSTLVDDGTLLVSVTRLLVDARLEDGPAVRLGAMLVTANGLEEVVDDRMNELDTI
jgi:hypothetical protein